MDVGGVHLVQTTVVFLLTRTFYGGMSCAGLGVSLPPVRIDSQCKYGLLSRGQGDIYLRLPRSETYPCPLTSLLPFSPTPSGS